MRSIFSLCLAALIAAGTIQGQEKKLIWGGYGQLDYNQRIDNETRRNGKLDVHRMVFVADYRFSERTFFFSEIEFEHVSEVYIEQAYLQHNIFPNVNIRAGLLLVPMGIINEFHEPPTYNGVERPSVDTYIVPTTLREMGAGFTGVIPSINTSYQAYVMTGYKGYQKNAGLFDGESGFRKGRQKGAESFISSPNLSVKFENYSVSGLTVGLAGYFGRSQSDLFNNIPKNDEALLSKADSSTVGISMLGIDARYNLSKFEFRGQYILSSQSGVEAYNAFTGKDLGQLMSGWYVEGAYLVGTVEKNGIIKPFVRYEKYNTHAKTVGFAANENYNITEITTGLSWHVAYGAAFKVDYNYRTTKAGGKAGTLNAGVAVMF
jgi:hypothetical protein